MVTKSTGDQSFFKDLHTTAPFAKSSPTPSSVQPSTHISPFKANYTSSPIDHNVPGVPDPRDHVEWTTRLPESPGEVGKGPLAASSKSFSHLKEKSIEEETPPSADMLKTELSQQSWSGWLGGVVSKIVGVSTLLSPTETMTDKEATETMTDNTIAGSEMSEDDEEDFTEIIDDEEIQSFAEVDEIEDEEEEELDEGLEANEEASSQADSHALNLLDVFSGVTSFQKEVIAGTGWVVGQAKGLVGEEGRVGRALQGAEQTLQAKHARLVAKEESLQATQQIVQKMPENLRSNAAIAGAHLVRGVTTKQGPNFKAVFHQKMDEKTGILPKIQNAVFPVVHEALNVIIENEAGINKALKSAISGIVQAAKNAKDHSLESILGEKEPAKFEQEAYQRIGANLTKIVGKEIDKMTTLNRSTKWVVKQFMKRFPNFVGEILQNVIKDIIDDMKFEDKLEKQEALKKGKEIELTGFKYLLANMFLGAGIIDAGSFLKKNGPIAALYIMDKVIQGIAQEEEGQEKTPTEKSAQVLDEFFHQQIDNLRQSGDISFVAAESAKAITPSDFVKGGLFVAREWVQDTTSAIAVPRANIAQRTIPGFVKGKGNKIKNARNELKPYQFLCYREKNKLWLQWAVPNQKGKAKLEPPMEITEEAILHPPIGFTAFVPPPNIPQAFKGTEKEIDKELEQLKEGEYMLVAGKTDRDFILYRKIDLERPPSPTTIYFGNPEFKVNGDKYKGNFEDLKTELVPGLKIREPKRKKG